MTYGDEFKAAMACENQAQANQFINDNLKMRYEEFGQYPEEGLKILKANLGCMAGYYGAAERQKVERLFGAVHPIFGSSTPTPEQAFAIGRQAASKTGGGGQ